MTGVLRVGGEELKVADTRVRVFTNQELSVGAGLRSQFKGSQTPFSPGKPLSSTK